GCFVALHDAVSFLLKNGKISESPIKQFVAAVSVGVVDGTPLLDLPYEEDFRAEVDMNVVMTENGQLVEVQGTAESEPFSKKTLNQLVDLAEKGIAQLITMQKKVLAVK
ncbi:MAG: ribonuclease PH, partial [Candidatus Margulisiibacteriota bacterium]